MSRQERAGAKALELVLRIANNDCSVPMPLEVMEAAEEIVKNYTCRHDRVIEDLFCSVCGWHNVPHHNKEAKV